jgi:hypothetical protein
MPPTAEDRRSEFRKLSGRTMAPARCQIAEALAALSGDDREDLEWAVQQPPDEVSNAGIARWLTARLPGTKWRWQNIKGHRAGACACVK